MEAQSAGHLIVDEVLAAVGVKAATENPFYPRVLAAVSEVLTSRREAVCVASLFAGLLLTLEKSETIQSPQICAAVCGTVVVLARRIPRALLAVHAPRMLLLYVPVLQQFSGTHPEVLFPALSGLALVFPVMTEPTAVPESVVRELVPSVVYAKNPGVARAAVRAVTSVLRTEALEALREGIFDELGKVVQNVVGTPLAAAAAASEERDSKKRAKLQTALDEALLSLMQLLSALAALLPWSSEAFAKAMVPHLWNVFSIQLPHISAMACDVLKVLLSENCPFSLTEEAKMEMLRHLVWQMEMAQGQGHEFEIAFVEAVHSGMLSLLKMSSHFWVMLLHVLPTLMKQLLSEFEEVREKTRQNLVSLLSASTVNMTVTSAIHEMEEDRPFGKICQLFEQALETDDEETLITVLPVVKALLEVMPEKSMGPARGLLVKLGELYGDVDSEMEIEEKNTEKPVLMKQMEACIGAGITHMGVRSVLLALPLNIRKALETEASNLEPRTWLLPLIKKYARGDLLSVWMEDLLPVANAGRTKAQQCTVTDPQMAFKCTMVEKQIWLILASFAVWPRDVASAFEALSQLLGQIFVERRDLQETVALVMYRLCMYTRKGCKLHQKRSTEMESDTQTRVEGRMEAAEAVPKAYDPAMAERDLAVLQSRSQDWFEILASAVADSAVVRGPNLLNALSEIASISHPTVRAALFTKAKNKLFQSFRDPSDEDRKRGICFDLLFAFVPSLSDEEVEEIIRVIELVIQSEVSHHVQKKGYKILAFVIENRPAAWIGKSQEMLTLLESTCSCCQMPSVQFRLRCLKEFIAIQALQSPSRLDFNELMVAFVPEFVLGMVDACAKAREKAKQALVQIGQHFADRGRFDELLVLLQTSLESEDISMVSGALKAMQCLMDRSGILFFPNLPQIMQSLLSLVKEREAQMSGASAISALLGFVWTASEHLSATELGPYIEPVVKLLLEWEVPMKKARNETKALLAQLCEVVGFDEVQKTVPEGYGHVMRNLRKFHRRSASQVAATEPATEAARTGRSGTSRVDSLLRPGTTVRTPLSTKKSATTETDVVEESMDLLDPLQSRRLARLAAGQITEPLKSDGVADDGFELPVNSEGKLVITEQSLRKAAKLQRKRLRESSGDEADDALTLKSRRQSETRRSMRTGGSRIRGSHATRATAIKSHHSGMRFKSKKGAGGDTKGTSNIEPYAYWKMDRQLLNKRRGKRSAARKDLKRIGSLRSRATR